MPDLAVSRETIDEAIDRAKAAAADLEVTVQKVGTNLVAALTQAGRALIAEALKGESSLITAMDGWHIDVTASFTLRKAR